MRCPKCGKKLDANASVCPVCKTKAEAQAVSSVPNHMRQLEYHRAGNFPNTTNSPAQSPVPPAPNNTVNTAATVLRLFGVEQPLCWTGEVPESIFL